MPCYSWGIPARACQVGAKLMAIKDSVCRQCYALKGYFRTHRVQRAYQRRLDRYGDHACRRRWIEAMTKLAYWQTVETGEPYFRWFDSGDLQSLQMLRDIAVVCDQTPEIRHWLPTREYGILREYLAMDSPPPNLVIRVSAPLVDGPAPQSFGLPTSTVHSSGASAQGYECPARKSEPVGCGECRACWDGEVGNVGYGLH